MLFSGNQNTMFRTCEAKEGISWGDEAQCVCQLLSFYTVNVIEPIKSSHHQAEGAWFQISIYSYRLYLRTVYGVGSPIKDTSYDLVITLPNQCPESVLFCSAMNHWHLERWIHTAWYMVTVCCWSALTSEASWVGEPYDEQLSPAVLGGQGTLGHWGSLHFERAVFILKTSLLSVGSALPDPTCTYGKIARTHYVVICAVWTGQGTLCLLGFEVYHSYRLTLGAHHTFCGRLWIE